MMFLKFAKFEFKYFLKQPSFYVTLFVFFLLPFFAMISDNVQIGGSSNVNFNSPHAITQTVLIMSLIGLFLVANFVGGTAVRDSANKMDGIMLSMPVSKTAYLWGRLFGSFLFCLLVFSAVPIGTFIGSFWPTVDAERLGETQLIPYVWSFFVFAVPNFLFCAALFYAFAIKARSMMGMYLGVVGFFILYNISQALLDDPSMLTASALLDPFGLGAFTKATLYWTPFERNSQLVPLEGYLLANRLLWLGVSFLVIVLTHVFVDIRKPATIKAGKSSKDKDESAPTQFTLHQAARGQQNNVSKFWLRTKFEISQVVKSAPFIILMLISFFSLSGIYFQDDGAWGTSNWPLTRNMADYIWQSFALMVLIIITYYSAETVWRERNLGIGDIVESSPIKNWAIYFPKVIALSLIIVALMLVGIAFTVFYQVIHSYSNFEWGVYAGILCLQFIIPMVMSTILAVFIQVLSPNKYVGMLIFVLYLVGSIVASNLGLEHNMFQFRRTPGLTYSDINQFGHFLEPVLWYNIYWGALTLVFVVLGFSLWPRGAEYGLKHRLKSFKLVSAPAGVALASLLVFVGSGSFIYYNTRVLNEFQTRDERLDLQAEYERKYKVYQELDVPTITDVNVAVDFYPEERRVTAKGYYLLENKTDKPIEKFLLFWSGGKNRSFSYRIEGTSEVERDDKFSTLWVKFDTPLQPKEQTRLDFEFERANKGFVDGGSDTRVVANGSFVNNSEILPHFGYNSGLEMGDRHERRKRDLPPPERLPKLEDSSQYGNNFISKEADFINFETVVSTSADQFAISPGYLQKQWTKDGRNYYHYKMDAPIFNFVAFLSGTYKKHEDEHKGIAIEVYHHPKHDMNVERMVKAVKDSLDYFGQEFSPYQHRQVRIIEFPRYARFAQSFSNTIPYSEDIGFIADLRDEDATDYVYFVTAHEMAHQWWGHQITPANVQGSAVLSETLSEYSAYMVMEKQLGKDQLRRFLKFEMDRYLRGRSREIIEEMPLYRAENQQYIHYQKGGVVMYAIRDRIGEETLNRALRRFMEQWKFKADPYPTTLDLLSFIKEEANPADHSFIDDLFKRITLFDLRVTSAETKKLDNDKYQLDLVIEAKKYYSDGQGVETETPLDNRFDIGVFSDDPDSTEGSDHVVYFEKHAIKTGENKISLVVDKLPKFAGVDPYIKMIDRNSDDNLSKVEIQ